MVNSVTVKQVDKPVPQGWTQFIFGLQVSESSCKQQYNPTVFEFLHLSMKEKEVFIVISSNCI